MLVGLTGSIGSGKSLAASVLAECGALVVDADELAREAVKPGSAALEQIREHFGTDVLDAEGRLVRPSLAAKVFNDESARRTLDQIVHPRVRELFEQRLPGLQGEASRRGVPVIYDVPLLFEAGYGKDDFDLIVVISAPRESCLARIMERDRLTRAVAEARYQAQMPIAEKEARADVVIRNADDPATFRKKVRDLYAALLNGAARRR